MKNILTIFGLLLSLPFVSAQCLQSFGCSAFPTDLCDYSPNNAELWNELYWWDNVHQIHDLSEGPTEIGLTVVDSCASLFIARFTLFLDLDNDSVMETVLQSDSLGAAGLGWNNVPFNNLQNPNYSGGTPRSFDGRPVSPMDKYGFALETVVNGDSTKLRLRWNTFADQTTYVDPQLPHGTHKITWYVMDTLGNDVQCTQIFEIKDCKAPTVVCLNGLAVNIMPTGLIDLWASDMLQYTEDNATPSSQLQIAVRKCGNGTGYPLDNFGNPDIKLTFICDELGTQCVELWSKDAAGNVDYCETYVTVQDNMNNCGDSSSTIEACIRTWCRNEPLTNVEVTIDGTSNFTPPFSYFVGTDTLNAEGCLTGPTLGIPTASNFVIAPVKDDFPSNGVTVLDLIKIRRFILGFEPELSPYAMIAADVNKSGSITGFDLLELRNLLTGVWETLPNNTAWRFVDADFTFPNAQNPFETVFPEVVSIVDAQLNAYSASFKAIKIGDLDCDAVPGFHAPNQDRGLPTRQLTLPDLSLSPAETTTISLQMPEAGDWAGLQLGLQFDLAKLEILGIQTGELADLEADAVFQPQAGRIHFVWSSAQPQSIAAGQNLLTLQVRAKTALNLSEVIQLADGFESLGSLGLEPQTLGLSFRNAENGLVENAIFAPQPNPTRAGSRIPFQLAKAGKVQWALSDLHGKTLWNSETDWSAGPHYLEIAPETMPQSGVYFWQMIIDNQSFSGRLIKL